VSGAAAPQAEGEIRAGGSAMAGKLLILAGAVLVMAGLAVWGLERAGFRGLPGDFRWHIGSVSIYFPLTTCLVLSVLQTVAGWLWRWWIGK
jgi:hypothetical protein